jgi:hypothetical protein
MIDHINVLALGPLTSFLVKAGQSKEIASDVPV